MSAGILPGMESIVVNGLKTAYHAGGLGPKPLLFVHGWASSGRMWLRSMWAFRHEYRMWAIDLPGCGASASPDMAWRSIERYTDHLAAFCEALDIRPYAVIGHSMGGRIAFDFARRYPDRVEKLVAISPALTGRLGYNLDLLLVGGLVGSAMKFLRRLWPIATAETMSLYWAPKYLGSEAVKRTTTDMRRVSWETATGSLRAMVRQDFSPKLAEVPHPTLLIHGQRDYTVPPDDSRIASRRLSDSQILELRGVHHQPTDEAQGQTLDAMRSFLANGRSGQA